MEKFSLNLFVAPQATFWIPNIELNNHKTNFSAYLVSLTGFRRKTEKHKMLKAPRTTPGCLSFLKLEDFFVTTHSEVFGKIHPLSLWENTFSRI